MHNPVARIQSYRVQSATYQSIEIWHGTGIYPRDMKGKRRKSRITRGSNARTIDVVSQLECAIRNPRAAALGALLGGIVPWFARALAHGELPEAWRAGDRALALGMVAVVIGCCLFSILDRVQVRPRRVWRRSQSGGIRRRSRGRDAGVARDDQHRRSARPDRRECRHERVRDRARS